MSQRSVVVLVIVRDLAGHACSGGRIVGCRAGNRCAGHHGSCFHVLVMVVAVIALAGRCGRLRVDCRRHGVHRGVRPVHVVMQLRQRQRPVRVVLVRSQHVRQHFRQCHVQQDASAQAQQHALRDLVVLASTCFDLRTS